MNLKDLLVAINDFRGRKFFIVLVVLYLVYLGRVEGYYGGVAMAGYFIIDLLEKYLVHKSEEDSPCPEKKDGQ